MGDFLNEAARGGSGVGRQDSEPDPDLLSRWGDGDEQELIRCIDRKKPMLGNRRLRRLVLVRAGALP